MSFSSVFLKLLRIFRGTIESQKFIFKPYFRCKKGRGQSSRILELETLMSFIKLKTRENLGKFCGAPEKLSITSFS